METKRKRKALADCTNTTSSSIKKHSDASAIKKLLADTSGQTVIRFNYESGFITSAANEDNCEVASKNPSSAVVASTPAKSSRVSGTSGERDIVEPCSVYSRRRTADKRKQKGKAVGLPLSGSSAATFKTDGEKNKEDRDIVLSKSYTEHRKKKKKDDPQHAMPPDIIEKQKAYFAEIDAFELPEEEVETIDQLE